MKVREALNESWTTFVDLSIGVGTVLLTIGERLKEERDRLRMTQPVLAAAAGVTKTTQVNYEGGHRVPDADYLASAAAAGVDVLYVLTGVAGDATTNDERQLLRGYRAASADLRAAALAVVGLAVVREPQQPSMSISGGHQGQVVQGNVSMGNASFGVGKKGGSKT